MRAITTQSDHDTDPVLAEVAHRACAAAMDALDVPQQHGLSVVLTTDAELQRLNRAHRGIDSPTDVLSFPFDPSDLPPEESPYLGDIVISIESAASSAARHDHTLEAEVRLLVVHGLLHLLGHEDETDNGAAEMHRLETELGVRHPDHDRA